MSERTSDHSRLLWAKSGKCSQMRIPGVAVQLARAVRYMRGYASDATADIRKELQELSKEYDEVRKELNEFRSSVGKDFLSVADEVDRTLRESQDQPIIEPGGEPPPSSGRSPSRSKRQ